MPYFSIVMPARNVEAFIAEAIGSCLGQEFGDWELIIVDDGCTDRTVDIARGFYDSRIRIVPGRGAGVAAAMNVGLDHASGDYVMKVDADDWIPVDRLRIQYDYLMAHPNAEVVCGGYSSCDSNGRVVATFFVGSFTKDITILLKNEKLKTHLGTFCIRREISDRVGGFREWFEAGSDLDFQIRIAEVTKVWFMPNVFYFYRLHQNSITHQKAAQRRQFFERMAYEFRDQRRHGGQDQLSEGHPLEPPPDIGKTSDPKLQARGHRVSAIWRAFDAGQIRGALKAAVTACREDPAYIQNWRSLAVLIFKASLRNLLRSS
jgi:glycosyltransferase involved in cell wall biosynthesis